VTTPLHRALRTFIFFAIFLIAGCASVQRAESPLTQETTHWQGRLALKVLSTPAQAFSANFELDGSAQAGSLTLSTALGSTLARMQWSPGMAVLQTSGETRGFGSLNAMVKEIIGTDLPVAGLFSWLQGNNTTSPPWEADLSDLANGRLTARRMAEPNPAELKILLDR